MKIEYNEFLMHRLMSYSSRYEISFQMWPNQYTIYIAKDGIDLHSCGGDAYPNEAMKRALEYLDRINKKHGGKHPGAGRPKLKEYEKKEPTKVMLVHHSKVDEVTKIIKK